MIEITHSEKIRTSLPFDTHFANLSNSCTTRLSNIYLHVKTGAILNRQGEVQWDFLDEHIYWLPSTASPYKNQADIDSRKKAIEAMLPELSSSKIIEIMSPHDHISLLHPFGWYAFGHLYDTLQKLYSLQLSGFRTSQPRKYIVGDHRRISDFFLHLELLQIPLNSIFQAPFEFDYMFIPQLVWSPPVAPFSQLTEDSLIWITDLYLSNDKISSMVDLVLKGKLKKLALYLSRPIGKRGLIEDNLLIDMLEDKGYYVLTLKGSEPLALIIGLFQNADLIIGAHGSMFLNTIFASASSKIIELCPSTRMCYNFPRIPKKARDHLLIKCNSTPFHDVIFDQELSSVVDGLV
jgi:Glycosyltransferase 61